MLAVFDKATGNPPEGLSLPLLGSLSSNMKTRKEIADIFRGLWPESVSFHLANGDLMTLLSHGDSRHPRSVVVVDDIFCIFSGNLDNTCNLRRHYGLSRQATEAMVLVEAYKVLRDRAPYPADQVIKDLEGKFGFILFDAASGTLFAARDRDGAVKLDWGIASDGSLVFSDDPRIITEACGKCCAHFPPGCLFMNGSGLMSFDHPLYKVKAIASEDDHGRISSVRFQVDLFQRLQSIPRSGSEANWAGVTVVEGENVA